MSRIRKSITLVALLLLGGAFSLTAEEFLDLTNTEGATIRAKVTALAGADVTIAMEDGRSFTIPLTSLAPESQTLIKEQATAPQPVAPLTATGGVDAAAINAAVGHELFVDQPLWSSEPSTVAERLDWKRESETAISESYRSYPRDDYRFLGARPFSAALYGEDDTVTSISIVFANKGDSYSSSGSGEDHFLKGEPIPGGMDGVRMLMEHDAETITTNLTALLGEPTQQRFGEGESRVSVDRWDWAGHAFLLSNVEEEYVSLAIQTVEVADDYGRTARVPDSVIRERARGFVENRENGDVIITNIPMVDQGPKGYCVPATAERCMRFLGISADMYLLAMAGETTAGGGTSVSRLLSNIGSDIKRKGRSFEIENGELKMREIQRSIDDGIPIIWALYSTNSFNDTANERTKMRKDGSWESYTSVVAAAAENPALVSDRSSGHVVIIIGYNEETNEIAFSDSWGERYLERWITIPEAEQVSQQRFYRIDL